MTTVGREGRTAVKDKDKMISTKQKEVRFDLLAVEKGWTEEMLKQVGDMPKVPLPAGTTSIGFRETLYKDVGKSTSMFTAEQEYQNLHKKFYEKLRKILSPEMKAAADVADQSEPPSTEPPEQNVIAIDEKQQIGTTSVI